MSDLVWLSKNRRRSLSAHRAAEPKTGNSRKCLNRCGVSPVKVDRTQLNGVYNEIRIIKLIVRANFGTS